MWSCSKSLQCVEKEKKVKLVDSIRFDLNIDLSDIIAKFPKSLLYNAGDSPKFYIARAEWIYNGDGLLVRIPTTKGKNKFVYALKRYIKPGETEVYLVNFLPERGSVDTSFTGKQLWLNLQNMSSYGLRYENDVVVSYRSKVTYASSAWEDYAIQYKCLAMGANNVLGVKGDDSLVAPPPEMIPLLGKPKELDGLSFGEWLRGIFWDIGNWVSDVVGGGEGSSDGGGSWGGGSGSGDGNWGGGYGGPGSGYDGGNHGGGGGGGGGGSSSWEGNDDDGDNDGDPGGPGRPSVPVTVNGTAIAGDQHIIAFNEIADENGYLPSKKAALEIYLQSNPLGMIDCNDINQYPMTTYQQVSSYIAPVAVTNHINAIISANSPAYTSNNFKIMSIGNADGPVVNCDYFYTKINSLPYMNNVQMTADQFLEYFRTHINDFIGSNVDVNFQPYIHYVAGSVNINETSLLNSAYESSLGAVIHIDMAYDGTVVESGYNRDNTAQHYWFNFSTMYSPVDGDHPVSGNRRFGIFKSGSSYYFYISGIDRTNDIFVSLSNAANLAFSGADALWHSVQTGVLDFFDTHQGDAVESQEKIARPLWFGPVRQFLKGQITLQQMKTALHCP